MLTCDFYNPYTLLVFWIIIEKIEQGDQFSEAMQKNEVKEGIRHL